ncbi:hypothetical protein COLO4_37894 [Corchorus olitorius]|uniref:Uncharacterized protein n=1 Tax=Corchorus olitorius TaxID=93759 RepID=A0A1R3FY55_9ROSI|nr:hypothetical protein COLO4_37894 [Corchorus olitorius]
MASRKPKSSLKTISRPNWVLDCAWAGTWQPFS